jgi:2-keto-4-pentenoate hydratase/2-oxohepta-3-ene-1,7-dioic acid hydratase in catechol pathway
MFLCRILIRPCAVKEGGRTPPPYPSIFIKPSAALGNFDTPVLVPKVAQEQLDYEGELVSIPEIECIINRADTYCVQAIVIGKTAKDIKEDEALDYIAGFVCANDVSCRQWQRDPAYAGSVPQWCFSKGFDGFAPIGPMIVSPRLVGAADSLDLQTMVNGEVRQLTNTSDLLFGVKRIVSFASQGTTLESGSLIMTGTPSGVAMGMARPMYLKDGDVVAVLIHGLGSVTNRMQFS